MGATMSVPLPTGDITHRKACTTMIISSMQSAGYVTSYILMTWRGQASMTSITSMMCTGNITNAWCLETKVTSMPRFRKISLRLQISPSKFRIGWIRKTHRHDHTGNSASALKKITFMQYVNLVNHRLIGQIKYSANLIQSTGISFIFSIFAFGWRHLLPIHTEKTKERYAYLVSWKPEKLSNVYKDSIVVLALGVGYYHYICTQGFLRTVNLGRSISSSTLEPK